MRLLHVFPWLVLLSFEHLLVSATCNKPSFQLTFPRERRSETYVLYTETISSNLTAWTLCFWAKDQLQPASKDQLQRKIFTYDNDESSIWASISVQHTAYCHGGNHLYVSSRTQLPLGDWFHMCCSRRKISHLQIFIDGKDSGDINLNGSQPNLNGGLFMLGEKSLNSAWNGELSEVQFWDRALNETEIANLANCTSWDEGNILSWGESDMEFYGDLDFNAISLPCGHCNRMT